MRIICATDFSASAAAAVEAAAALAHLLGDSLDLLHVVQVPAALPLEALAFDETLDRRLSEAASARLAQYRAVLESRGIAVNTIVRFGFADDAIITEAGEGQVRFLVLGTHGRKAAARFFLGSLAERAVRLASCPVLVVPPHPRGALGTGSLTGRPLRILAGFDVSAASEAALAFVRGMTLALPCDVTFVHVYHPLREHARLGIEWPPDLFEADPVVVSVLDRELRPRVGPMSGTGKVELRIRPDWGEDRSSLAWEADLQEADLLVVGRGGRGRRGATTVLSAIRDSHVPVLCVPAAESPRTVPAPEPLRRVLVASDLSDHAPAAAAAAYRLMRGCGGIVDILHVVAPRAGGLDQQQREELDHRLRALAPPGMSAHGISTRVSVVESPSPAEAIVQAVHRLGADMVVVATHGRSGLARAVLGSVADMVVRTSPKPVLVVAPEVAAGTAPESTHGAR